MAWRIPPVWKEISSGEQSTPENSKVLVYQKQLQTATRKVLLGIAADVRAGLLETVGVESVLVEAEKCSIRLHLPDDADAEMIARAIDAENIEAWCDSQGSVHIGISPWYSTKDVDQTVLCTIKVIHVLLGIHAADSDAIQPRTLSQKLLKAVTEVLLLQKKIAQRKN